MSTAVAEVEKLISKLEDRLAAIEKAIAALSASRANAASLADLDFRDQHTEVGTSEWFRSRRFLVTVEPGEKVRNILFRLVEGDGTPTRCLSHSVKELPPAPPLRQIVEEAISFRNSMDWRKPHHEITEREAQAVFARGVLRACGLEVGE